MRDGLECRDLHGPHQIDVSQVLSMWADPAIGAIQGGSELHPGVLAAFQVQSLPEAGVLGSLVPLLHKSPRGC